MDGNSNDGSNSNEVQPDEEAKSDQENTLIKTELTEDVSPCVSPVPSNHESEIAPPRNNSEQRDHSQKRKKSPPKKLIRKKPRETIDYEPVDDSSSETEEHYIIITDMPKDLQISDYVEECGVVDKVMVYTYIAGQIKLKFQSVDDYNKVRRQLTEDKAKGNNFSFRLSEQEGELSDAASDTTEVIDQSSWRPEGPHDAARDPLRLYGLQLAFLRSLDITPPLDRWVHVTNFRCDKFELRDVMELAGRVLSCSVIKIDKRFAKVQYSHPLEAVQAVSMLNGQMYFGMKLKVDMERNPGNDVILPKGLVNIGLGLGLYGRPVRDIERQYELFSRQQNSTLNPILFRSYIIDGKKSLGAIDRHIENQISFREFMSSTKRLFEVKHAEDLDSTDAQSEKDSPESNSLKSLDSPASNTDAKEKVKINDYSKVEDLLPFNNNNQPEIPGVSIPVRLQTPNPIGTIPIGTNPIGTIPRPNAIQNIRPQAVLRPGLPVPQVTNQYQAQFRGVSVNTMHESRPNLIVPQMSNPIGNPPRPGPFGHTQLRPQTPADAYNHPGPRYSSAYGPGMIGPPGTTGHIPTSIYGPGPIHRPGPVHSVGLGHGHGPIQGPGPAHAAGPIQGPGPAHGTGSIQGPGPAHVQASIPGSGPGPMQGPGPAHGPMSMQGPGPAHGPGPMQGPGPAHGPGPMHGPGPAHGPGPIQGPGPAHGPGPIQEPGSMLSGPIHRPGPVQRPVSVQVPAHSQGPGYASVNVPGSLSGSGPGSIGAPSNKVTVEFANLPPSTTFPFFCEKLSQFGQVTALKFTTPGCAVASFSHPSHAERCYQNFSGVNIEGYRIVASIV